MKIRKTRNILVVSATVATLLGSAPASVMARDVTMGQTVREGAASVETPAMADPIAVTLLDSASAITRISLGFSCFGTIHILFPTPIFPFPDPCVCQFWYPDPWRFPCI